MKDVCVFKPDRHCDYTVGLPSLVITAHPQELVQNFCYIEKCLRIAKVPR